MVLLVLRNVTPMTMSLWPNGWMDQDAIWYGVGLGSDYTALDGDPAPLPQRGTPNFRPMSVVAKRLDRSRCHLVRR